MSIQSDIFNLTDAANTRVHLTSENITEALTSFSSQVGAFVKGEQTCIVYRLRIGMWVWKDEAHTQKDVGRIGDLLCIFCKTYTLNEQGEKVWTQGDIKLLTQAQFDSRAFKELVIPTLQDQFVFL